VLVAVPRKRTKHSHPGDDTETKATTRLRGSLSGEPDEGVLQAGHSFGRGLGEVDRKGDRADWREDCGGKIPNASEEGMRGWCTLIPCHQPAEETTRTNPQGQRSRWLRQTNEAHIHRGRYSGVQRNAQGKAEAD
jgi:hypothetical protein